MARTLWTLYALAALVCAGAAAAQDGAGAAPAIDTMDWRGGPSVCAAWPEGKARSSGLAWVGLPAAVKPYGMRAYVSLDGMERPLRQIAYARAGALLAIQYRTLGERAYDVRLELSGLDPEAVKGADLKGRLIVSRFGLFTEIRLAGSCAAP